MKKNASISVLAGGILILSTVNATAQSVSYMLKETDPSGYRKSVLYIDPFNVDTYLTPCIGGGFKLETVIAQHLMPFIGVKYSYLDAVTLRSVTNYPIATGGLKKQLVVDAGAAFFVVNKNKKKNVKVILSSHKSGDVTTTKFLTIPSEVKKLLGFEGGLYYNRKALEFRDGSHPLYHYRMEGSTASQPIADVTSFPSGGQPSGNFYKPMSMARIFSVFGGIRSRRVTHTVIKTEKYGTRANNSAFDMYADMMISPGTSIKEVVDNSGTVWEIKPQAGAIRHLGWRAGFAFHNSFRTSFQYSFEFGQKPGPKMGSGFLYNGSYISLGVGIAIGFNKEIKTKDKAPKTDAPAKTAE